MAGAIAFFLVDGRKVSSRGGKATYSRHTIREASPTTDIRVVHAGLSGRCVRCGCRRPRCVRVSTDAAGGLARSQFVAQCRGEGQVERISQEAVDGPAMAALLHG